MEEQAAAAKELLGNQIKDLRTKYELKEVSFSCIHKQDILDNRSTVRAWYAAQIQKQGWQPAEEDDIDLIFEWLTQNMRMKEVKADTTHSEYFLQCALFSRLLDSPLFKYHPQVKVRR